jgi:hypothetical protein
MAASRNRVVSYEQKVVDGVVYSVQAVETPITGVRGWRIEFEACGDTHPIEFSMYEPDRLSEEQWMGLLDRGGRLELREDGATACTIWVDGSRIWFTTTHRDWMASSSYPLEAFAESIRRTIPRVKAEGLGFGIARRPEGRQYSGRDVAIAAACGVLLSVFARWAGAFLGL